MTNGELLFKETSVVISFEQLIVERINTNNIKLLIFLKIKKTIILYFNNLIYVIFQRILKR